MRPSHFGSIRACLQVGCPPKSVATGTSFNCVAAEVVARLWCCMAGLDGPLLHQAPAYRLGVAWCGHVVFGTLCVSHSAFWVGCRVAGCVLCITCCRWALVLSMSLRCCSRGAPSNLLGGAQEMPRAFPQRAACFSAHGGCARLLCSLEGGGSFGGMPMSTLPLADQAPASSMRSPSEGLGCLCMRWPEVFPVYQSRCAHALQRARPASAIVASVWRCFQHTIGRTPTGWSFALQGGVPRLRHEAGRRCCLLRLAFTVWRDSAEGRFFTTYFGT